jgi:hypothetical protein
MYLYENGQFILYIFLMIGEARVVTDQKAAFGKVYSYLCIYISK